MFISNILLVHMKKNCSSFCLWYVRTVHTLFSLYIVITLFVQISFLYMWFIKWDAHQLTETFELRGLLAWNFLKYILLFSQIEIAHKWSMGAATPYWKFLTKRVTSRCPLYQGMASEPCPLMVFLSIFAKINCTTYACPIVIWRHICNNFQIHGLCGSSEL